MVSSVRRIWFTVIAIGVSSILASVCVLQQRQLVVQKRTNNESAKHAAAIHQPDKEYELLVLVLAGGYSDGMFAKAYSWQRTIWSEVAKAVARLQLPVKVYMMALDPNIQEPSMDKNFIKIPGKNSVVPGCLEMTIQSMEFLQKGKYAGYRHKYVLRTNLSSFWCFHRFLKYLNKLNATQVYHGIRAPTGYVSGSGILMSRNLETLLLQQQQELNYKVVDDIAIGDFFRNHNITATQGMRQDFTEVSRVPLAQVMATQLYDDTNPYHYRIKTLDYPNRNPDREQDNLIMSYLFFQCYGETVNVTNQ